MSRRARVTTAFLVAVLAFSALALAAEAPDVGSQLPDIDGSEQQPPAQEIPETTPVDDPTGGAFDGVFDDLGFGGAFALGVVSTVALGLVLSAAVMGGTKFVNNQNVLDNDARRTIFEYIKAHPGVHLRAAATALSLSTTNVLWHLRKLEQSNLVASRKFEGYKVFYPSEGGLESRRRAIASNVLRNAHARSVLEWIVVNPSAHQREIARHLGVNHGTVRWHLRKLNDAGLVLQIKKESHSMYYVTELGNQALAGWDTPTVAPPQGEPPAEESAAASSAT